MGLRMVLILSLNRLIGINGLLPITIWVQLEIGEVRLNLLLKSKERIYLVIFLILLLQINIIIAIVAISQFLISRFLKCVNMKMLKKTNCQENHFALLDPKEALDDFFQIKVHFMLILNPFSTYNN